MQSFVKSFEMDKLNKKTRLDKNENNVTNFPKNQIAAKLAELKNLKENGLISEETWEEKQKEILKRLMSYSPTTPHTDL